jgi:polysaccharide pyruvyl transferase WcaK-like protein
MRIAVIHADRQVKSGDELLVEESTSLLRRLGVPENAIHVIGSGPRSCEHTAPSIEARGRRARHTDTGPHESPGCGAADQLVAEADAVVAVGGDYLRARTWSEGLTTLLTHGRQLRTAADRGAAAVYLPQSIGPLNGPTGARLRKWLRRLPQVAVRDDRSLLEVPHAMRVPDLRLLRLTRQTPSPQQGDGTIALLAPPLPAPGRYEHLLRTFAEDMRASALPLQTAWQCRVGAGGASSAAPSLVVSTLLHNCVQAVSVGVPAIHLSDGHTGPAAFHDLGLAEFVHPARSFSPEVLAMQCRRVLRTPDAYWDRVVSRLPQLSQRAAAYEEQVAQSLGLSQGRRREAGVAAHNHM